MRIPNMSNPRSNMNLEQIAREDYLNSIEDSDERYGQAFESLDNDDLEEIKEYQLMKQSESLKNNGLHIVKTYV